ncbi:hypothetical protein Psuf_090970 [Phytohabitans suffuscus]|uniref:Uncharacterized protein n=1 Tax=Phytohabitans suffuscus TaxID=624315 RepID=A0A6F8Z0D8_9ACTN|nr:hypothetical protein Psuf_090970 [Phytohabitans suffuscus]
MAHIGAGPADSPAWDGRGGAVEEVSGTRRDGAARSARGGAPGCAARRRAGSPETWTRAGGYTFQDRAMPPTGIGCAGGPPFSREYRARATRVGALMSEIDALMSEIGSHVALPRLTDRLDLLFEAEPMLRHPS